jgi:hypothetical protein
MSDAIIPITMSSAGALASGRLAGAPAPRPLGRSNIEAELSYREELAQIVITLRDTESGQVVRQIPPEQVLQFAQFLRETNGRILDACA